MKEKDFDTARLANKLNVSERAVEHWIKGRNLPSVVQLFKLSRVFDKTVDELYWMFKNHQKNVPLVGE